MSAAEGRGRAVAIAVVLTMSVVTGVQPAAAAGPIVVKAPDGAVRGMQQGAHRLYQGIPYAAAPGRWDAPERVTRWQGIRDASSRGAECVQAAVFWRPEPASWNEDCLNLNVFTPRTARAGTPVMVWFHGGGLVNGAGTDVQPVRMTEWGRNVVVTVNWPTYEPGKRVMSPRTAGASRVITTLQQEHNCCFWLS